MLSHQEGAAFASRHIGKGSIFSEEPYIYVSVDKLKKHTTAMLGALNAFQQKHPKQPLKTLQKLGMTVGGRTKVHENTLKSLQEWCQSKQLKISTWIQVASILQNYIMLSESLTDASVYGVGLYRMAIHMNHACDEPALFHFTDRQTGNIFFIAQRDIEKGEELTISYRMHIYSLSQEVSHIKFKEVRLTSFFCFLPSS